MGMRYFEKPKSAMTSIRFIRFIRFIRLIRFVGLSLKFIH
jgi:hypothetical protein